MNVAESSEVSYGRRLTELAFERPNDADLILVAADGTERQLTFQELETRANQIARLLELRGVDQGDVVALAFPNGLDHILVTIAIWKLGATLLPLRHDVPQWEMDRVLELANPVVLVSDRHVSASGGDVVTSDDLQSSSSLASMALKDRTSECVTLMASSGSTGRPKLIKCAIRGVVADDPAAVQLRTDGSTILVTSPLYHVNGFAFASPPILEGSRSIVMEKFDAAAAVALIERHQVTLAVMVPTMLQRIASLDGVRAEQFASLQTLVYGGAKIPEWLVDRWLELVPPEVFTFTYGSSERIGLVTMTGADWGDHRGATGQAVDATISIRDDDGAELGPDEIGHIFMRPDEPDAGVFQYIGMPTPEPTYDGFYTIGDLGWLDADGFLYIADRRKDMIVTGGANVFPAEVESALSEHRGVLDQVVVAVADDEWGQRVHAIVQPVDPTRPPGVEELRAHCKERLAAYKVPKTYEIVDRIPRTEAGKINRTDLGAERG